MKIFGLTITKQQNLQPVPSRSNWLGIIREPFAGAWQKNVECDGPANITAFSAVYSCISLIAGDISKLRQKLMQQNGQIWQEVADGSPFLPVLRKPNRYQTRVQFLEQWIALKLLHGNAYALKQRDERRIVTAEYPLDPRQVTPLVADDGSIYYELKTDRLAGVLQDEGRVVVPASEIIHDRMNCLWHPLVGVSPIYACGASATQGSRIQANSAKFFENMSRPSGVLSAPGAISDETAGRLKASFEANFGGLNIGRLLVAGDGLKYEAMTIPAQDAQLIEQLRWTVEDVARAFGVPLYKLGIGQPPLASVGALNQEYYSQCLQRHIESYEVLQDEGLGLTSVPGKTYGVELEIEGLVRMDPKGRAETNALRIGAGELMPNEARQSEDREPVEGGDACYLQQQNFSLAALAKRDALPDPFGTAPAPAAPVAAPPPEDGPSADERAKAFLSRLKSGLEEFEHA